jgi:hypothetical protein
VLTGRDVDSDLRVDQVDITVTDCDSLERNVPRRRTARVRAHDSEAAYGVQNDTIGEGNDLVTRKRSEICPRMETSTVRSTDTELTNDSALRSDRPHASLPRKRRSARCAARANDEGDTEKTKGRNKVAHGSPFDWRQA